jgi:hypothetical protein
MKAVLIFLFGISASAGPWDGVLQDLRNGSFDAFDTAALPLGNMTALSYTATFGAYFDPSTVHSAPLGWKRSLLESNPVAGMRAIVFEHEKADGRIVVAFRGTDLDVTKPSGQADSCADALLFENATRATLPAFCAQFNDTQLDYLGGALNFTQRLLKMYPAASEGSVFFTGHSLGASLALLVSAKFDSLRDRSIDEGHALTLAAPAAVFSAGGSIAAILRARFGDDPSQFDSSQTILLANTYDPVYNTSQHTYVGDICLWLPSEPAACVACYKRPFNAKAPECELCFEQSHVFSHYLDLLATPPRPVCTPRVAVTNTAAVNIEVVHTAVAKAAVAKAAVAKAAAAKIAVPDLFVCPSGQQLDVVEVGGDNGSCDCDHFCATDWSGGVVGCPNCHGMVSIDSSLQVQYVAGSKCSN